MTFRFKHWIFVCLLLPTFLYANTQIYVNSPVYKVNEDYKVIASGNEAPHPKPQQPVVMEFFSYYCHWCYSIDTEISQWAATHPNINFERIPIQFNDGMLLLGKAYFTAKALGKDKIIHPALFAAIQEHQFKLNDEDDLENFFAAQGVDKKTFLNEYQFTPRTDAEISNVLELTNQYHVSTIPTFIINNTYETGLQYTKGDIKKLLSVIDYLLTLPS